MKYVYQVKVMEANDRTASERLHYTSCLYSTLDKALKAEVHVWLGDEIKIGSDHRKVLGSNHKPATLANVSKAIKESGVSMMTLIFPKEIPCEKYYFCVISKTYVV